MNIKVGDIVSYNGINARVMRIGSIDDDGDPNITLAASKPIRDAYMDELELVESVKLPELKPGELVIVHDIPTYEKEKYGCYWVFGSSGMDAVIEACKLGEKQTIEEVRDHPEEGLIARIGGFWFQMYHLASTNNYDMI